MLSSALATCQSPCMRLQTSDVDLDFISELDPSLCSLRLFFLSLDARSISSACCAVARRPCHRLALATCITGSTRRPQSFSRHPPTTSRREEDPTNINQSKPSVAANDECRYHRVRSVVRLYPLYRIRVSTAVGMGGCSQSSCALTAQGVSNGIYPYIYL